MPKDVLDINSSILLLHGEEQVAMTTILKEIEQNLPHSSMGDLNLTRLEGRSLTLTELANHLQILPLGAEKRLVILQDAQEVAKSSAEQEKFTSLLEHLPQTTQLVMVIVDYLVKKKKEWVWAKLPNEHWLKRWLDAHPDRAKTEEFRNPLPKDMTAWLLEQAAIMDLVLSPSAASALASAVGNDTLLAEKELYKLGTYVAGARAISAEDVKLLVCPVDHEDIFALVDAIAEGNARTALKLLEISLQNQPAPQVFSMIARQFRLLIIAAEIMSEKGTPQIVQQEMHVVDWLAEKYMRQARRLGLPALEAIFQRLAALDAQIKESHVPDDLALEMFVAQMARR